MKRVLWFAGVSTAALVVAAAPALAGGNDPRIDLAPSSALAESSGLSHGDAISFTLTSPRTSKPEVRLVCGQDAAYYRPRQVVLDETLPYYGDGTREFVLASDDWTSGGNTCVAWLMRKGEPEVGVLFWVNA
jgi:hypothetical protein